MKPGTRRPHRRPSLRDLAERRMEGKSSVHLGDLTPDEIAGLVHELEVHKVELQIQNDQLRETQRATEASKEHYRRLYDSAPIGYVTLDADAVIVEANLAISILLKTPRSGLIGKKFGAFVAPHHQDRWYLGRQGAADGRRRMVLDLELVSAAGSALYAQLVGTAVGGDDSAAGEVRLAVLDVTQLRETERALQAAARAASLAEERERRTLAADLHDDAGQLLSLASLKLHALGDAPEVERGPRMREMEELLAEIRRRISSLSFQLSPPLLHDVGLGAALEWLAENLRDSYGLVVTIAGETQLELDEPTRVAFFRASRELLLNVAKHAGVKEARVRIWEQGDVVRVAVEDDGVGLSPEAPRHGFGLLALRERAEQLGGTLETRAGAGRGTTVVVSLPRRLPPPENEGERR